IIENNVHAQSFVDFKEIANNIKEKNLGEKDILITMGAGEAFVIGNMLLNK
ncbi:hypothetical protein IT400_03685, partial [Candidatus Nomurabacteria bacterium]|nr:hypothetical protein [Candidatus Nomurabacteria bacterium]